MLFENLASIIHRKRPVNLGLSRIAAFFPGNDFSCQRHFIWQTTVKALGTQNADFDFRHIEPGTVSGSEMKSEAGHNPIRFGFSKEFDE